MNNLLYFPVGLIFSLLGVRLVLSAIRQTFSRRKMEDYPRSRIRGAAMGYVEVGGTVRAGRGIKAPFSGEACLFVRWRVSESAGGTWRVVEEGSVGELFPVDDGTGQLLVDPTDSVVSGDPVYQITTNGSGIFIPDRGVKDWLEKHPNITWRGDIRFTEWRLVEGQSLFLRGDLTRAPEDAPSNIAGVLRAPAAPGKLMIHLTSETSLLSDARWQVPFKLILGGAAIWAGLRALSQFRNIFSSLLH